MVISVTDGSSLSKVARIARLRAFSATPPSPHEGSPPFDHALPNWLDAITPPGADVLHTNQAMLPLTAAPWTTVEASSNTTTRIDSDGHRVHESRATANAYRPERHPSQAQRGTQRRREARIAEAWQHAHALSLALVEFGVGQRTTGRGALALAETALWLAGPDTREPGVPISGVLARSTRSRLSTRIEAELHGARHGRNGAHITRIECAASHDLAGAPAVQLSRAQGWADHEDFEGRPASASSAKRAIREGRDLLHRLGAWPWAHVDHGRLHEHREWWLMPEIVSPLRQWIARSWGHFVLDEFAQHSRAHQLEPTEGMVAAASTWAVRALKKMAVDTVIALNADDELHDS